MKSLLIALLIGGTAMAADTTTPAPAPVAAPHLSCAVPIENGTATVKLEVTLGTDASIDFVTLALTGPGTATATFFMQMDKGAFGKSLQQGSFQTLLLQEAFAVNEGVYEKAGLISVNKEADGTYTGLMAALGNIYPLACK